MPLANFSKLSKKLNLNPVVIAALRVKALNMTTLLNRRVFNSVFRTVNGFDDINSETFFLFNDNITRGHLFRITTTIS